MQHNTAPPLVREEAERAFDLISICRGEYGGTRNNGRVEKMRARRRIFAALDQPNRATWRTAAGCYVLEEGEVVVLAEAVRKHTGTEPGETPTREQLFFTLEVLARYRP